MNYATQRHLFAIAFSLILSATLHAQSISNPAIQIQGDRTIIYPTSLDLPEKATVKDVLQLYPDLLQEGFEQVLANYQLRIDGNSWVSSKSVGIISSRKNKCFPLLYGTELS